MTIAEIFKDVPIGSPSAQVTRPNHNMHIFIDFEGILRDSDTQEPPIFTHQDIIADDWAYLDWNI
jgi:hypothetical protein